MSEVVKYIELIAFVFTHSNKIPKGTVVFKTTNGKLLGNARLDGGVARLKIDKEKFNSQVCEIKAYYAGGKGFSASQSNVVVKEIK